MPDSHPLIGRPLTFVHAVNSRARLRGFLGSQRDVAEADITIGVVRGERLRLGQPIMAHPPLVWSDLSLTEFAERVQRGGRVVKLDFKSPRSLEVGLPLVNHLLDPARTIINIDCVRGPGGEAPVFRPEDLGYIARTCPGAVLSIGATTRARSGPYRPSHTSAFLAALAVTDAAATVAIRAEPALLAPLALEPLTTAGVQFTIWNSAWWNRTTPSLVSAITSVWPRAWLDLTD